MISLVFIYKGRGGSEASLRRGADMAIWIVVLVTGIYIGISIANDMHVELPLTNDLIPKWFSWRCGILDLGYFAVALPIVTAIVRSGRANTNQPTQ